MAESEEGEVDYYAVLNIRKKGKNILSGGEIKRSILSIM